LESAPDKPQTAEEEAFAARAREAIAHFDEAMDDDLNTADALGAIFDWALDMNATLAALAPSKAAIEAGLNTLGEMTGVLGILTKKLDTTPENVRELVEARQAAKKEKRFADADRIRGEVLALGYVIETPPPAPRCAGRSGQAHSCIIQSAGASSALFRRFVCSKAFGFLNLFCETDQIRRVPDQNDRTPQGLSLGAVNWSSAQPVQPSYAASTSSDP
jgi:hypothetical protein